ncbi:MAG: chlorohydrolase [Nitrospinaceae bacterium]|nr:MAG: chlorohydrolase [Nitrospinaceae bacterium]
MNRLAQFIFLLATLVFVYPAKCFGNALSIPSRTLIQNASLTITMDPSLGEGKLGLVKNSDLLFDTKILSIGKNLPAGEAKIINGKGKLILPGFVDVHNHLWQSLIRGCGADKELMGWLKECVSSMKGTVIDEEAAYAGVRISTLDLLSTGVTTVVDNSHGFTPQFVRGNLRALEDSRLRYVIALCGKDKESSIQNILKVKSEIIDKNHLASLQICSHPAPKSLSNLKAMSRLSRELNVPFNVHLLESRSQIQEKPLALLQQADALNPRLFVNHAVHVNEEEISLLSEHRVSIAHNPLSNMRLGSGITPLPKLHSAGLKIGLGLDGGTNDTSDMFGNMRAAVGLQRIRAMNGTVYPQVEDILRIATLGGAEALHMENEIGSLSPGKAADIVVMDALEFNFAPEWDVVNQIVFNGQPRNVKTVFVEGKALWVEGQPVLKETTRQHLIAKAQKAVERIKQRLSLIPQDKN